MHRRLHVCVAADSSFPRLWKLTSGISGFLLGFFLVYFIVVYIWSQTTNIGQSFFVALSFCLLTMFLFAVWIAMGAGCGAGILIGLLLFFFPTISLFIVAIIVGAVLGIIIYDIAVIYTGWQYAYFVCVGVGAIVVPLIAICIKKVRMRELFLPLFHL